MINVTKDKKQQTIIKVPTKEDATKLQTAANKIAGIEAATIEKFRPHLVLYGIEQDFKNEEILSEIYERNEEINEVYESEADFKKEARIFRLYGKKEAELKNVVLEVTPKIRNAIRNKKIKLGWRKVAVEDCVHIKYCFKCLKSGHIQSSCTETIAKCRKCGENHGIWECRSLTRKCAVCVEAGEKSTEHIALGKACNIYLQDRRSLIAKTDYGF